MFRAGPGTGYEYGSFISVFRSAGIGPFPGLVGVLSLSQQLIKRKDLFPLGRQDHKNKNITQRD